VIVHLAKLVEELDRAMDKVSLESFHGRRFTDEEYLAMIKRKKEQDLNKIRKDLSSRKVDADSSKEKYTYSDDGEKYFNNLNPA
jgi:hypothetical protein